MSKTKARARRALEGTGKILLAYRFCHVFCLWAFLPLDDLELNVVTFLQALVAFA
jgi:hypothetical protein